MDIDINNLVDRRFDATASEFEKRATITELVVICRWWVLLKREGYNYIASKTLVENLHGAGLFCRDPLMSDDLSQLWEVALVMMYNVPPAKLGVIHGH